MSAILHEGEGGRIPEPFRDTAPQSLRSASPAVGALGMHCPQSHQKILRLLLSQGPASQKMHDGHRCSDSETNFSIQNKYRYSAMAGGSLFSCCGGLVKYVVRAATSRSASTSSPFSGSPRRKALVTAPAAPTMTTTHPLTTSHRYRSLHTADVVQSSLHQRSRIYPCCIMNGVVGTSDAICCEIQCARDVCRGKSESFGTDVDHPCCGSRQLTKGTRNSRVFPLVKCAANGHPLLRAGTVHSQILHRNSTAPETLRAMSSRMQGSIPTTSFIYRHKHRYAMHSKDRNCDTASSSCDMAAETLDNVITHDETSRRSKKKILRIEDGHPPRIFRRHNDSHRPVYSRRRYLDSIKRSQGIAEKENSNVCEIDVASTVKSPLRLAYVTKPERKNTSSSSPKNSPRSIRTASLRTSVSSVSIRPGPSISHEANAVPKQTFPTINKKAKCSDTIAAEGRTIHKVTTNQRAVVILSSNPQVDSLDAMEAKGRSKNDGRSPMTEGDIEPTERNKGTVISIGRRRANTTLSLSGAQPSCSTPTSPHSRRRRRSLANSPVSTTTTPLQRRQEWERRQVERREEVALLNQYCRSRMNEQINRRENAELERSRSRSGFSQSGCGDEEQ